MSHKKAQDTRQDKQQNQIKTTKITYDQNTISIFFLNVKLKEASNQS